MTRDIADPNHMPVTRDLSGPKRATILRWLEQLPAERSGMSRATARTGPRGIARDAKTKTADAVARRAVADQDAATAGSDEG